MQVWGGRLGARCGPSWGREDCGRGVGIRWDGLYVHVEAAGASKGGQAGCALWALEAKRTMGGGLGWGWDGLCMHVEAMGASKGGQAGCALWALSGPRGLWEGGWDGVGIACVCT